MTNLTQAATDVLAERERQKTVEGWTAEHDDAHSNGEIAGAAATYAVLRSQVGGIDQPGSGFLASLWPWDGSWFKPSSPRRDLVKAGALILAEIERLDRANTPI